MQNVRKIKRNDTKQLFKIMLTIIVILIAVISTSLIASANEASDAVDNLNNYIIDIIKSLGVLLVIFGLVMFGVGFSGHDTAQKMTGGLMVVGGVLMYFAENILDVIGISI